MLGALEKLIKNVLTNRFHEILCCYHLWTTEHGVETTQICAYFQTFFGSFMIRCDLMHLKCARLAIETHHKLLDIAGAKRNTKKNDNCRLKTNDSVEKISSDLFYVRDFVDRLPYRTFCWAQMKHYAMQHDAHHNVCTWWKISIALVRHSMRMAARARSPVRWRVRQKMCNELSAPATRFNKQIFMMQLNLKYVYVVRFHNRAPIAVASLRPPFVH